MFAGLPYVGPPFDRTISIYLKICESSEKKHESTEKKYESHVFLLESPRKLSESTIGIQFMEIKRLKSTRFQRPILKINYISAASQLNFKNTLHK
jgi:hypothetical protein